MKLLSLQHHSLRVKLLALSVLVAGIGAIGGATGLYGMTRLGADTQQITEVGMPGLEHIRAAQIALVDAGRARAHFTLATTDEDRAARKALFYRRVAELKAAFERAESAFDTEEGRQLYREASQALALWLPEVDKFIAMMADKPLVTLDQDTMHGDAAARALNVQTVAAFDKLVARQQASVQLAVAHSDATYQQFSGAIIAIMAAALGLGIGLGWWLARAVARPLQQAVQVAQTVATGDLRSNIDVQGSDEAAQLLRALGRMNDSLVRIVGEVRSGSQGIATGSSQIATGNADLSQRTEEQASNLQQTAASMEQLTATVKQNADTARQANLMADSASDAARQGGQAVGQVVSTMELIAAASSKIAEITNVIDSIAFQTNILALNAAVEAARAGEQGRGFAVVASEVRILAQRSADAAKDIKALIGDSTEKVSAGTRQVQEAQASMDHIVEQVQRVGGLIGEISNATQEQSTGIGQVGHAVNQLDQVTQQNAALVEESAAAAESLRVQAAKLSNLVATFKLHDSHGDLVRA